MPSRRTLLAALSGGIAFSTAGCTALSGPGQVRCASHSEVDDENGPLTHLGADFDGETVFLVVGIADDALENGEVSRVALYDSAEQLAYEIPVMDNQDMNRLTVNRGADRESTFYAINLGDAPKHGIYRGVAYGPDGDELGAIRTEFNCFQDRRL